jgi:hypothetical protein
MQQREPVATKDEIEMKCPADGSPPDRALVEMLNYEPFDAAAYISATYSQFTRFSMKALR